MKEAKNCRTDLKKYRCAKRMQRSVLCFLFIVALVASCCTVWLLGFAETAMADENEETFCGYEEHQHNEDCYEKVLVCGQEECDPVEGHTHTEECYETEAVLICELEEDEEHTHNEDCYLYEQTLICEQEECDPVEGHTHTEECYAPGENLICELPEHEHVEQCYSDATADLEDAGIWEATLPTELSGVWEEDLITVALSQLGYTESTKNFLVNENGTTPSERRKGYTRYGAWYGDPYGDWCAMFVSFCLNYAGVSTSDFPRSSNCVTWTKALERLNMYEDAKTSDYLPETGDLIFFHNGSSYKSTDHVGIVENVEYQTDAKGKTESVTIHTIEGNSGNCVKQNTYSIDDGCIIGYGVLPKQGKDNAAKLSMEGMIIDLTNMLPVLSADGYECIGMVSIPRYGIELPVIDERNHLSQRIIPVQYEGFVRVNEPVLCGYNHNRCFGNLKYLTPEDSIFFVAVDGEVSEYRVEEALTSQSDAEEEVQAQGADAEEATQDVDAEEATQDAVAEEATQDAAAEEATQDVDAEEETADEGKLTLHVRTTGGGDLATVYCTQQT